MEASKGLTELASGSLAVRIVSLPPMTVAAAHHVGDDPEMHANGIVDRFVSESDLVRAQPDLRRFGFNHPNPMDKSGFHGYESWVSVPEDFEVAVPLVKKRFAGGLYATTTIDFGDFGAWDALLSWITRSEDYEFAGDLGDQEHMCGLLEEQADYAGQVGRPIDPETLKLDLLAPVRPKAAPAE